MLKISTNILAIVPLVLLVLSKILWIKDDALGQPFLLASYVAESIFIIHLIVKNRAIDWFYSAILGLILVGNIGILFKSMHWPFAAVMVLAGVIGSILCAPAFLYSAINKKHQSSRYFFLGF